MKILFVILSFTAMTLHAQIPQSTRSKKATQKHYPLLEKSFAARGLVFGNPILIRILKEEYKLDIWVKKDKTFTLYKTYDICTYSGGLGPKKKQGDGKSPEGFYYAKPKSLNPYSSFHLSFDTNYPNEHDRANAYTGSALMIHGNCVSIGCYAMTDERIEEIYSIVQKAFEKGQDIIRIHIFPFAMNETNMNKYKSSEYYSFWETLKPGYDFFEKHKTIPKVAVKNKKYVISQE